jgi:hypothetical protein
VLCGALTCRQAGTKAIHRPGHDLARQPQRGGRSSRTGALQADLPQVQLRGREVRVRRVVQIEPPDSWITEQHRPAPVGLQPVLVWVDHDRVTLGDCLERSGGHEVTVGPGKNGEEAAVRAIHVYPHAVLASDRHDVLDAINHAQPGRAGRNDDGPDPTRRQKRFDRIDVHPPGYVTRNRDALDTQHVTHPAMRVVRLRAVRDCLARMQLSGDEECFQVGDSAARREVAQRLRWQMKHCRQLGDEFLFHDARGLSPIERMVVGIVQHRSEVANDRRRMRWLQHLPDIARMKERIIPLQPLQQLVQRVAQPTVVNSGRRMLLNRSPLARPKIKPIDRLTQPLRKIRHW